MLAAKQNKGFTLVEILIVVVILGILAAIVIPQFTNASETAKASSLISQLQTIRSQLELARVEHNGYYPDLSTNWNYMTTATARSSTSAGAYTAGSDVGPYLQQAPKNPFQGTGGSDTVIALAADGTASADANSGWAYRQASGEIKACMATAKATEVDLNTQTNDILLY